MVNPKRRKSDFPDTVPGQPMYPSEEDIIKHAEHLVSWAQDHGWVVTIERVSDMPLAMGNHHAEIRVWKAIK